MRKSVGIIGAGAAGLCGARHMMAAGFDVALYEIGSHVGGMWVYKNDNKRSSAYKTLHINTAKDLTAFADFPFAESVPPFPNHRDMATYLNSYARHFEIVDKIKFNTRVARVRPAPDYTEKAPRWLIETENGDVFEHDTVIVATGHLTKPLEVASFRDKFQGEYLHSHDYKDPAVFANKRVCIVGVGNSGLDIASDVCMTAESTVLVARSRPLIIPKLIFGKPFWDVIKPFYHPWVPTAVRNKVLSFLVWTVHGSMKDLGFPKTAKKVHATSNANIVNNIRYRRVRVKPGIEHIEGKTITFSDGSEEEFDTLITATGYLIDLDFIPPEIIEVKDNSLDLYMRVVPPDWRGLYFLAFFNSDTALNWIAEGQAKWLREFELGNAVLPEKTAMLQEIRDRKAWVDRYFKSTERHGIEVEHLPYFKDLTRTLKEAYARRAKVSGDKPAGQRPIMPELRATK